MINKHSEYNVRPKAVFLSILGLFTLVFINLSHHYPTIFSLNIIQQYNEYNFSDQQFSVLIVKSYFFAYLLGLFFAGFLIDFLSTKIVLSIMLAVSSLSLFYVGYVKSFDLFIVQRYIAGVSNAFLVIGIIKLISNWLPRKFFPSFISIFFAAFYLLSFVIYPFESLSSLNVSSFLVPVSIFGFSLLTLILIFARNANYLNNPNPKMKLYELQSLFTNKNFWLVCAIGFLSSSLLTFTSLLGLPFLVQTMGITYLTAVKLINQFYIGAVFGTLLIAFFSQYFYNRKSILLIKLTALTIISSIIVFYHPSAVFLSPLLFLMGFFAAPSILLLIIINDISSKATLGVAFSILLFLSLLGITSFQFIMGNLSPDLQHLENALFVIPLTLFISVLLASLISNAPWTNEREKNKLHPFAYLKKGWQGKLSLGRSFWVIYCWGSLVYIFMIISFLYVLTEIIPIISVQTLLGNGIQLRLVSGLLYLPYLVISLVSVCNCAKNWEWWVGWQYIALTLIVFKALYFSISLLFYTSLLL